MALEPQYHGSGGGLLPASETTQPHGPLGANKIGTVPPLAQPVPSVGSVEPGAAAGQAIVEGPRCAELPTPCSALMGRRGYVVDAGQPLSAASIGFAVGNGGGTNTVPVFCTGKLWIIG